MKKSKNSAYLRSVGRTCLALTGVFFASSFISLVLCVTVARAIIMNSGENEFGRIGSALVVFMLSCFVSGFVGLSTTSLYVSRGPTKRKNSDLDAKQKYL
jgi:hypothetical protein